MTYMENFVTEVWNE